MKKYQVSFEEGSWLMVYVEYPDDAEPDDIDIIKKAYEEMPGDICAHCSGWGKNWSRNLGDDRELAKEMKQVDGKWVEVEVMPELVED